MHEFSCLNTYWWRIKRWNDIYWTIEFQTWQIDEIQQDWFILSIIKYNSETILFTTPTFGIRYFSTMEPTQWIGMVYNDFIFDTCSIFSAVVFSISEISYWLPSSIAFCKSYIISSIPQTGDMILRFFSLPLLKR